LFRVLQIAELFHDCRLIKQCSNIGNLQSKRKCSAPLALVTASESPRLLNRNLQDGRLVENKKLGQNRFWHDLKRNGKKGGKFYLLA